MRTIILAAIFLAGCTPARQPIFTESAGMLDHANDAYAACENLVYQAGQAQADIDPQELWDWCMVKTGAAI